MADKVYKVKYVGGQGVRLTHPLTDGRVELPGHEIIELTDYGDFVRLTDHPSWEDHTDDKEATVPAVEENSAPVETPDEKVKSETTTTGAGKTDTKAGDTK